MTVPNYQYYYAIHLDIVPNGSISMNQMFILCGVNIFFDLSKVVSYKLDIALFNSLKEVSFYFNIMGISL